MNSETIKFIRSYVMRVYNDCNLLTFGRGMKDLDNNYYLLRVKDFLCDLFFCVFSSGKSVYSLINIQDIFLLMHLVTETGRTWLEVQHYDNRDDIAKKIDSILNNLKIKPNDMCIFVNQDLEYYNYLIDYLEFYLTKFVKCKEFESPKKDDNKINTSLNVSINNVTTIKKNNNNVEKMDMDDNKTNSEINNNINSISINNNIKNDEKMQEVMNVLFLLNDVNFRSNHEKTKHLILCIIEIINDFGDEDVAKQIELLKMFYNLKYKDNLNKQVLNEIQILYINSLISQNNLDEADSVIKNALKNILPNTRDEVIYYLLNFYLLLKKNEQPTKLGEMFLIVLQHQELKIDDINEILLKIFSHKYKHYLLKILCEELSQNNSNMNNKNKTVNNNLTNKQDINKYLNAKIEFSFNTLINMPNFILLFNYLFIETFIYSQENKNDDDEYGFDDKKFENLLNNESFFELLKIMSECLLENYINNEYKSNNNLNIPILLHNLVYLFVNKTKNTKQNVFANYFLIDIINKFKKSGNNSWKEFSLMSMQLYIEKKDYYKLQTILKEIETDEKENKNCMFIYAKIISILGEGVKWNTVNSIENYCQLLNETDDFDIVYYIKIFRFIYDNKIEEITLLNIILDKYCHKNIELYESNNKNINKNYLNGNYSMIDCCYEVLFYCSHLKNFCAKIEEFCDILEMVSDFLENLKIEEGNNNQKLIITNISIVCELIKLLISFKNLRDFKCGKYSYPDYIISTISKFLNFLLINFDIFLNKEFLQNLKSPVNFDTLQPVTILFQFYQNTKIFTFSSLIEDIKTGKNNQKENNNKEKYIFLKEKYRQYQQNFINAIKIYTNTIQNYDNKYLSNEVNDENNELLMKPKLNKFLTEIYNETGIYDEIILLKLTINSEEKEKIKNYITKILNNNCKDKKFINIINSVLFSEGLKDISNFLISELINKIIITNNEELFNKIYSTNDIFDLYKEMFNSFDDNDITNQIKCLKSYQNFLSKLYGKIEDANFYQHLEWLYFQIYQFLDRSDKANGIVDEKNNYGGLKAIFDEINNLFIGKEKPLIIEGLIDLIIKKTL